MGSKWRLVSGGNSQLSSGILKDFVRLGLLLFFFVFYANLDFSDEKSARDSRCEFFRMSGLRGNACFPNIDRKNVGETAGANYCKKHNESQHLKKIERAGTRLAYSSPEQNSR